MPCEIFNRRVKSSAAPTWVHPRRSTAEDRLCTHSGGVALATLPTMSFVT